MRFRTKVAGLVLAAATAAVPAIAAAGPASASGGAICAQSGTGFCLNDWNNGGSGNAVKMGQQGWPNQAFSTFQLTNMCNHGTVSGTCPFSTLSVDSDLIGEPIVGVRYNGGSLCLGLPSSTSVSGILTPCPNLSGTGGGWGVVMVEDFGCNVHLDDVRATDTKHDGSPYNWRSPGVTGGQVVTTNNRDGGSCWG